MNAAANPFSETDSLVGEGLAPAFQAGFSL